MQLSTHYTEGGAPLPDVSDSELLRAEAWYRAHFNVVNTTTRYRDDPKEIELEWKNFLGILASYRKSIEEFIAPPVRCNVMNCQRATEHDSMQHFAQAGRC